MHQAHLNRILKDTRKLLSAKYTKGQKEHGGELWKLTPLQLVTEALNEALDQVTYLHTLREVILKNIKT